MRFESEMAFLEYCAKRACVLPRRILLGEIRFNEIEFTTELDYQHTMIVRIYTTFDEAGEALTALTMPVHDEPEPR